MACSNMVAYVGCHLFQYCQRTSEERQLSRCPLTQSLPETPPHRVPQHPSPRCLLLRSALQATHSFCESSRCVNRTRHYGHQEFSLSNTAHLCRCPREPEHCGRDASSGRPRTGAADSTALTEAHYTTDWAQSLQAHTGEWFTSALQLESSSSTSPADSNTTLWAR